MPPSKPTEFFASEGVVKAAGKTLLALLLPYYLAIPAACILLLLYLFAFRGPNQTYVRLPLRSVPSSSPSAGPALSDTLSAHSVGKATLGVGNLSALIEISYSRKMC